MLKELGNEADKEKLTKMLCGYSVLINFENLLLFTANINIISNHHFFTRILILYTRLSFTDHPGQHLLRSRFPCTVRRPCRQQPRRSRPWALQLADHNQQRWGHLPASSGQRHRSRALRRQTAIHWTRRCRAPQQAKADCHHAPCRSVIKWV